MIIVFTEARIEHSSLTLPLYDICIHAAETYTRVAVRGVVENGVSDIICSTTIAATAVALT